MTNYKELVPRFLATVAAYVPGKLLRHAELESGVRCIKLASNENPFGPSPLALEAARASAAELHFYTDNNVTELRDKLAETHGVAADQVLVTSGSTSFIDLIARTLLGPGLNAITSER